VFCFVVCNAAIVRNALWGRNCVLFCRGGRFVEFEENCLKRIMFEEDGLKRRNVFCFVVCNAANVRDALWSRICVLFCRGGLFLVQ